MVNSLAKAPSRFSPIVTIQHQIDRKSVITGWLTQQFVGTLDWIIQFYSELIFCVVRAFKGVRLDVANGSIAQTDWDENDVVWRL
jgi:hypothetical protein